MNGHIENNGLNVVFFKISRKFTKSSIGIEVEITTGVYTIEKSYH